MKRRTTERKEKKRTRRKEEEMKRSEEENLKKKTQRYRIRTEGYKASMEKQKEKKKVKGKLDIELKQSGKITKIINEIQSNRRK